MSIHPPGMNRDASPADREHSSLEYLRERLVLLRSLLEAVEEQGLDSQIEELVAPYLDEAAALRPTHNDDLESLPALERLRRRFDLNDFEENVLLLALSPQVDSTFGDLVAMAVGNIGRTQPDVGLALELFARSFHERVIHRRAFGPDGALITNHLLNLDQRTARNGNFLRVGLSLPARVQSVLLEERAEAAQLEGFSRLVWSQTPLADVVLPARQKNELLGLVGQYDEYIARRRAWGHHQVGDGGDGIVLLFSGPPGTGKTLLSHAVANELSRPLLLVDVQHLQSQRGMDARLDEIMREARLQRAILFFDDCESLFASRLQGNRDLPTLLAAIDSYPGIAILSTNLPGALDPALDRRITMRVDFDVPPPSLRERIWRLHLPEGTPLADDVNLTELAEKYEFAGGHIRNSVVVALNRALARVTSAAEPLESADDPGETEGEPRVSMQDLDEAARSQVRHRLKALASRGANHLTLNDVILPEDVKDRLEAIIAATRNRRVIFDEWGFGEKLTTGKGLCCLFRGDSGTGKTLSAEILANELAMPLYRVRIPSIVSKYVGETEKNLEKCFREAGLAGALLLFDEADSIFSKRVDVSSSNDRYSNMEVNLLLQEVERFEGVVILTTNLDAGIDDAFERRLNFKIDFPFPDADARTAIWRHLIPDAAPLSDDVSFEYLGEDFDLSGGSIKNAVIRAAYEAAERKCELNMKLLEAAAEQEYRELGKLVPTRRNPWD